jgi:rubrerythrin
MKVKFNFIRRDEMNKKDTKKEAFYFCHVCGEFFNVKGIGHCPECDHHYP